MELYYVLCIQYNPTSNHLLPSLWGGVGEETKHSLLSCQLKMFFLLLLREVRAMAEPPPPTQRGKGNG